MSCDLCKIYCCTCDIGKPKSISFLVSLMMPRNFETHLANFVVAGHRIVFNCCSVVRFRKVGFNAVTRAKKHCLFRLKSEHSKIACCSVSHCPLSQYLHMRCDSGVTGEVWRPVYILILWADVRKRLSQALCYRYV